MGLSNIFLPAIAGGVIGGIGQGASQIAADNLKREEMARKDAQGQIDLGALAAQGVDLKGMGLPTVGKIPVPLADVIAKAGMARQDKADELARSNESREYLAKMPFLSAGMPATIQRGDAMDLNENPEAAGMAAPIDPGTPAVTRETQARYAAGAPGLKATERQTYIQDYLKPQPFHALGEYGGYDPNTQKVIGGAPTQAPEPPLREGYTRGYHQDAKGRTGYTDTVKTPNETEIAVNDWIKNPANAAKIQGLAPEAQRDVARTEIDKRKVGMRVEFTNPSLSKGALDDAAQYVLDKGMLPANLGMGNARQRTAIFNRAAEMRAALGDSAQGMYAAEMLAKANQGELNSLQKQRGTMQVAMRTASDHLARAEQLSQGVDRTEIPALNQWLLSGQTKWAGNPQTATFAAVTKLATDEVAKVITAAAGGTGGVVSDAARKEVHDILQPAFAKGQFSEVATVLRGLMQDRAKSYEQMVAETAARGANGGRGAPSAPAAAPGTNDPLGIRR